MFVGLKKRRFGAVSFLCWFVCDGGTVDRGVRNGAGDQWSPLQNPVAGIDEELAGGMYAAPTETTGDLSVFCRGGYHPPAAHKKAGGTVLPPAAFVQPAPTEGSCQQESRNPLFGFRRP